MGLNLPLYPSTSIAIKISLLPPGSKYTYIYFEKLNLTKKKTKQRKSFVNKEINIKLKFVYNEYSFRIIVSKSFNYLIFIGENIIISLS